MLSAPTFPTQFPTTFSFSFLFLARLTYIGAHCKKSRRDFLKIESLQESFPIRSSYRLRTVQYVTKKCTIGSSSPSTLWLNFFFWFSDFLAACPATWKGALNKFPFSHSRRPFFPGGGTLYSPSPTQREQKRVGNISESLPFTISLFPHS